MRTNPKIKIYDLLKTLCTCICIYSYTTRKSNYKLVKIEFYNILGTFRKNNISLHKNLFKY